MSNEKGQCGFGSWQWVCLDCLTENLESLLASFIGTSGVGCQAIVKELLSLKLEIIGVEYAVERCISPSMFAGARCRGIFVVGIRWKWNIYSVGVCACVYVQVSGWGHLTLYMWYMY